MVITQLLPGFFAAIIAALLAYRAHSLSRSGMYAAALVGTVIFGLGGWRWAVLLLAFFISASALTRAFGRRKQALSEKFAKGGQRDAGQVLANGGAAALFAALHAVFPAAGWPWLAFAASLAAVNADTWATELGVLSPTPPRLSTNLRKVVERGASGGISPLGTLAALGGAALIGLLAALLKPDTIFILHPSAFILLIVSLAGLLGSLADSCLGATLQAIYCCPKCSKETERHPLHTCGAPTTRIRGWRWLNNDWVNFACGAFGAITILLLEGGISHV